MKNFRLLTIGILASVVLLSYGNEANGDNDAFPFSLNLVYPQTQIEVESGYFYIDLKANETEELSIEIHNNTSNYIGIAIETADCYTAPQGGLIYVTNNTSDSINYTDRKFMMAKNIVPSATKLSLKPDERSEIRFNITAPSIQEGEVIGAVRFIDITLQTNNPTVNNESNLQIKVNRAMTIPIRVRLSQSQSIVTPTVAVGEVDVNTDEGKISLSISNNLQIINRSAKISYNVLDSFGNKIFEGGFDLEKMAPKTSVKVPIEWIGAEIVPGKYTFKVNFPISDTQTDTVSREITINQNVANEIITETTNPKSSGEIYRYYYIYLGVVFLLLIVIIVLMVLLKKKRKKP